MTSGARRELRSVNHRFLEPHIRLPEELRALETAVRERLAARLQRGKVDCGLRYAPAVGAAGSLRVTRPFVTQLIAAASEVGAWSASCRTLTHWSCCVGPGPWWSRSGTWIRSRGRPRPLGTGHRHPPGHPSPGGRAPGRLAAGALRPAPGVGCPGARPHAPGPGWGAPPPRRPPGGG